MSQIKRRYPVGAELRAEEGVHFRLWAPDHQRVDLLWEHGGELIPFPMDKEKGGYFSLWLPDAKKGMLYRFRLDDSQECLADPASRFQPQGPLGPSCVVDASFPWSDSEWKGVSIEGQILYEMHIGTFTQEGSFTAASAQLEELAALGVTTLEIMPLNDFPGHYGWGYDGVNLYAPSRLYGSPSDVKAFIDKAHSFGLGVILDVVYNHLGPACNQLRQFTELYFSKKYTTEWGEAVNFDEKGVREFFLTNARYWIEEYHFDGLRVDATSCLFCSTEPHILKELTRVVRDAGGERAVVVIGENEPQNTDLLRPYEEEGMGFDALWNDDFHHTALVRLTGKREAYYTDYLGTPQEFISCFKYGFLYQGQYYSWQNKKRGTLHLELSPAAFVIFLENHDQVANSGQGKRLTQLSDLGNLKALTCLLLLGPNTPMLFQGQEFGSSRPFHYFADHTEDLNHLIDRGRRKFLAQFRNLATAEARHSLPNPADPLTFTKCKLNFREREDNAQMYALHKDLLKLRREDPVLQAVQRIKYDGAILGDECFLLRYFGGEAGDCLIIVNFGPDHMLIPAPEPLLVAGKGLAWGVLWSSESFCYAGEGSPPIGFPHWKIVGHSAIVLKTKRQHTRRKQDGGE